MMAIQSTAMIWMARPSKRLSNVYLKPSSLHAVEALRVQAEYLVQRFVL